MSSMVSAHLSATGQLDQLSSLGLGVTLLDMTEAGTTVSLMDKGTAAGSILASRARGYMDGRTLAEVFAWLRPDDLIWNYWVNNYLQGKTPPPFDILYWNADTTRMPAALHRNFIEIAMANALTKPGAVSMLGSPVDLSKIDVDSYVVAGIDDHISPWPSAYRATQLLRGNIRFVLSNSGHIAAMVNPPSNPKATFRVAPATRPTTTTGWPRPRRCRAAGGLTTPPGWQTAAARRSKPRRHWAARSTRRWTPRQGRTSWSGSPRQTRPGIGEARCRAASCAGPRGWRPDICLPAVGRTLLLAEEARASLTARSPGKPDR